MKRALVIGCGPRVMEDIEVALKLCRWDRVYPVNLAGAHWTGRERFSWVTLHPGSMDQYKTVRSKLGLHGNFEVVAPALQEVNKGIEHVTRRVSYRWPGMKYSGSSSLFAVKVALYDRMDRIVLAGVPMTEEPHFVTGKLWRQCPIYRGAWNFTLDRFRNVTRSLSGGWTEQLLGRPTEQWLTQSISP